MDNVQLCVVIWQIDLIVIESIETLKGLVQMHIADVISTVQKVTVTYRSDRANKIATITYRIV